MMSQKRIILVLNILAVFLQHCQCFPGGGGAIQSACSDMMPQHGVDPIQTTPPPYNITFSGKSYQPNSTVSVTIASSLQEFKGFMIQARRAEANKNQEELLGSFEEVAGTAKTCDGRALSHSSRSSVTVRNFNWNTPSNSEGHVVFRATFVQERAKIYVGIESDTLLDANINTTTVGQATSPTGNTNEEMDHTQGSGGSQTTSAPQSVVGNVIKDSECGNTKGCLSDCENDQKCTFIISWQQDGDDGVYSISSQIPSSSGSWVAVGFSSDSEMGDDSVTGCAFRSDLKVEVWNAENKGKFPVQFDDDDVKLESGQVSEGVLTCKFRRPIAGTDKRVAIDKPWTLLFARGKTRNSITLGLDKHASLTDRLPSSRKFRVSDTTDGSIKAPDYPLVKAHGSLMVGAWIFFASVGIVAARYCKPVWKNLMFSQKVWFQIHRLCMILVFCTTVAGFVIIFIEVEGWSDLEEDKEYLEGHPIMGVIVTALTVINPVMAIFRPHPGTPNRYIFNWAHWFVGTAGHILGVITIFFGVQLSKADGVDYLIYILAGYVAWQVFVELLLEFISCYGRKKDRSELYEMNGDGGAKVDLSTESEGALFAKGVIFALHCFVVAAVAAVVIALLAVGKTELED